MTKFLDEPLWSLPSHSPESRPAAIVPFPIQNRRSAPRMQQLPRQEANTSTAAKQSALRAAWCALCLSLKRRAERRALTHQLSRLPDHLLADIGVNAMGKHHDL